MVERVRNCENALGGDDDLATAVAKSYFKLLSYKDEYEVARLHTRPEFIASVRAEFGAGAKFRFHLAPPFLNAGLDARGRPRKREFGAWILPLFRILARMRGLRGTALDIFGRTAERRLERELIVEFEELVDGLLPELQEDQLPKAAETIGLYMNIRGFGPVKQESVDRVRQQIKLQS